MASTPLTPQRAREFEPLTPVRWWSEQRQAWNHGVVIPQTEVARRSGSVSVRRVDGAVFVVMPSKLAVTGLPARLDPAPRTGSRIA